jgi:hypothetical protein
MIRRRHRSNGYAALIMSYNIEGGAEAPRNAGRGSWFMVHGDGRMTTWITAYRKVLKVSQPCNFLVAFIHHRDILIFLPFGDDSFNDFSHTFTYCGMLFGGIADKNEVGCVHFFCMAGYVSNPRPLMGVPQNMKYHATAFLPHHRIGFFIFPVNLF